MFFRRKANRQPEKKTRSAQTPTPESRPSRSSSSAPSPADRVSVREVSGAEKPARRSFPGPRGAAAVLRVAVDRRAHAELIAHAKESLELEVCGVLAGHVCEDDEGVFVHVEAVICGAAASEGSTHVTFTQATWNAIHATLDHDYPKLQIVGWYHTHPGFGVEFSDMDLFIQRNFFGGANQIALVTDPLSGAVAVCVNTPRGIEYLPRFWVDGREQLGRVPEKQAPGGDTAVPGGEITGETAKAIQALETRISQLVQVVDEQRRSFYRFLVFLGIVFCLTIVAGAGYFFYSQWNSRLEPPHVNQVVPLPVQIGDKVVILGVAITSWEVPPELNALMLQMEQLKKEAAEKAAREAEKNAGKPQPNAPAATNAPTPNLPANPPPPAAPQAETKPMPSSEHK